MYSQLKVEMKEKFQEYIVDIDSEFAQKNYKYVLKKMTNEKIQSVYKILGPVDFYMKKDDELKEDLEENDQ